MNEQKNFMRSVLREGALALICSDCIQNHTENFPDMKQTN